MKQREYTVKHHVVDHFIVLMVSPLFVLYLFVGKRNNGRHLTWRERLRIALESAQGNYFKFVVVLLEV